MKVLCLFLVVSLTYADPRTTETPFGTVTLNIQYGEGNSHKTELDLYAPRIHHYPVVVFVHGGSFINGDRKEFPYNKVGESFQQNGIGCAVISYRLAADSAWPAQPRDVARALAWVKRQISKFDGDSTQVFVVGHSAGGHLAALVSTDAQYLHESGLNLRDIAGCVAIGTMMSDAGSLGMISPQEQVSIFATDWYFKIFGTKELFIHSLPCNHVTSAMPRTYLLLGDKELYDPPKLLTVEDFVYRARKVGAEATYAVLPDRTHMGVVEGMIRLNDPAMKLILSFIKGSLGTVG